MRSYISSAAAVVASVSLATAQTFTSCNPLQKTCPKDVGLPSSAFTSDFTDGSGASKSWSAAAYSTINYGSQGAEFSISGPKQAPTTETDFYIFFGRIDVKMKAAEGTGIVSSIVLESDDLDEIDWEFLGGNYTTVETNFFGKGNTTVYDRAIYYPVDSPQTQFHTYSIDWNAQRIEFIIDGTTVRTIPYDDPLAVYGKNYPQTPMKLKLGSWCGGCAGEPQGTVAWAGGKTTFDNAPYVMYVESVNIQNYNPADSYEYSNMSGDWQSITITLDGKNEDPPNSVTGASSGFQNMTQTAAPTKSHHVGGVKNTNVAVSTTVTGKSYSMNTKSISKQNQGGKTTTTAIVATTQVPGSQPTNAGPGGAPGTGSGDGSGSSSSASASSPAATGGASQKTVAVGGFLIGFFLTGLLL